MLENLKEEVYRANLSLRDSGLVIRTWGNVSGRDPESGLIVIKPSGVEYDELRPSDLPVLSPDGKIVEGTLKPSSDAPTHLELYKAFPGICGVAHTHSEYATVFAQAKRAIPALGTTHADYFPGGVPVTRPLSDEEIAGEYELNTGKVVTELFRDAGYKDVRAALVASHGPFCWGSSATEAADVAFVLEEIAKLAWKTLILSPEIEEMQPSLQAKHYLRKHGKNAYYGQ